ncbi:MAG: hypothetical protein JST58_06985 [Bacteroidetes bacterium]|nr:hypothetical protein [Bacteroidota bacterium]
MAKLLTKVCLLTFCALYSLMVFAGNRKYSISFSSNWESFNAFSKTDSGFSDFGKNSTKICSCQILALQTSYRRQRNFALFAEITKRRNMSSDLHVTRKVLDKEKRYMRAMFYDKVEVINTFSEATDCRSLFKKLKTDHKQLYMYDILDADIRR